MAIEEPVHYNASSIGRSKNRSYSTPSCRRSTSRPGLVLFQWDALDHIPLRASYTNSPGRANPYDYFHLNSVFTARDGNIVLSGRSVSSVYKVARRNGHIMWTLGGKHSSFKMGPALPRPSSMTPSRAYHNVVSVFDNGAGPVQRSLLSPGRSGSR